jgi:hypothetical protein
MLNTAMIMINKAIDADSAVLEGEKKSTAAMGTIWDGLANILAQADDGAPLTATQRRQFGAAFDQIDDESTGIQLRLDKRFQKRAVEDLAPRFADRFNRVGEMAPREPLNIPNDAKDEMANMPADVAEKIERFIDADLTKSRENIEAAADWLGNQGAAVSGAADELIKKIPTFGFGVPGVGSRPTN